VSISYTGSTTTATGTLEWNCMLTPDDAIGSVNPLHPLSGTVSLAQLAGNTIVIPILPCTLNAPNYDSTVIFGNLQTQ